MPITTKERNKQQKGIRIVVYVFVYNNYNKNSFFSFFFVKKLAQRAHDLKTENVFIKIKEIYKEHTKCFNCDRSPPARVASGALSLSLQVVNAKKKQ